MAAGGLLGGSPSGRAALSVGAAAGEARYVGADLT